MEFPAIRPSILFILLLLNVGLSAAQCSASNPCTVGCCSNFGFCGFGPDFCNFPENCQDTCDAVAECGEFAEPGKENCPLNVCCSEFGFCGTTADFCGTGCQNGCGEPQKPSCSAGTSSDRRTIAYFESWNLDRPCDNMWPEDIKIEYLTHINFAFATVGPDGRIAAATPQDMEMYKQVTGLKDRKPSLKVWIAVGGWAVAGPPFSNMAATAAGRAIFISSVIDFMETYAFDGIDIDWEYPVAEDRGGVPADKQNYVLLLQELRAAVGARYGISIAIPASYWYLQNFDLAGMEPYVDWFNFMSYDIHGTWDGLDLVWRNEVPPSKITLGLAFYGRAFTLADPACNTPGCVFAGGAAKGECTGESGILSNAEIFRRIDQQGLTPVLEAEAGVKYVTFDGNQWVSYDDGDTFKIKKAFANSLCLGGTMIWAVDLDSGLGAPSLTGLAKAAGDLQRDTSFDDSLKALSDALEKSQKIEQHNDMGLITYWTPCTSESIGDSPCAPGFRPETTAWGVSFDAEYGEMLTKQCEASFQKRWLCVEEAAILEDCKWYGMPKQCNKKCPSKMIRVASNTGPPTRGRPEVMCQGGTYSNYCCAAVANWEGKPSPGFCPNAASVLSGGSTTEKNLAARLARKQDQITFNRGSNLMFTDLECDMYKFGDRMIVPLDAIINVIKGFWTRNVGVGFQFAWDMQHYLPWSGPDGLPCISTTTTTKRTTSLNLPVTSTCSGSKWPQACQHYQSVFNNNPLWSTLTCPFENPGNRRSAVNKYRSQHHSLWHSWVPPPIQGQDCQRDEFPFLRFMGAPNRYVQYIRFLNGDENGGAGQMANRFCPDRASVDTQTITGGSQNAVCTETLSLTTRLNRLFISFDVAPGIDFGLTENTCRVTSTLWDDPGFALFTDDPWYNVGVRRNHPDYKQPPPAALIQGHTRPRSLDDDLFLGDPEFVLVDDGNSTRKAGSDDLWEKFGILRCASENCEEEKRAYGLDKDGKPIREEVEIPEQTPTVDGDANLPNATPASPGSLVDKSPSMMTVMTRGTEPSLVTPVPGSPLLRCQ